MAMGRALAQKFNKKTAVEACPNAISKLFSRTFGKPLLS